MDPPQSPSQPPPTQPPSPSPPQSKLRLMCSYGGQIIPLPRPRPHTKSLFYLGGETRLISLNPSLINTLSSFISHLSINLSIESPFTLKYQLPHSTLDSLISVSSDDDLQFMFCEHVRVLSANSRIRLFLFDHHSNVIDHPKTESWFFDALKSAKISVGFDGLIGENEGKGDLGNGNVAESLVLETSSSFGSSSSSSTSLPNSMDNNNAVKSAITQPAATLASETCHGVIAQPSSLENAVVSIPVISESNFQDPRFQAHNVIDFPSYQLSSPSNHGMVPVFSYYQVPPQQQQFLHYQQNQLYHPVYFPPVGQTQMVYFPTIGKTQPPIMYLDSTSVPLNPASHSLVLPQVSYKEVKCEPPSQIVEEASFVSNPTAFKPRDEIQQPPQFGDSSCGEVSCNHNESNDDPARIQIYKSQPPPPVIPSQFQNKTKASTTLLSDAMAQLHMIQIKQ